MAYMASRGGNRNDGNEMRRGGNRNEYSEMRGNYDETRRGGNRNAYDEPNEDYSEIESRYRGRDGRWKAGRRRGEMNDSMDENWPEDARSYEARNEYRPRTDNYGRAESRYKPDYPIAPNDERRSEEGRRIGFGNDRAYEARSHYDGEKDGKGQTIHAGGTFWMENPEGEKLDKKALEKWVHKMEDDKGKPIEPWSPEEIKPLAMRFGYPSSGEEIENFYAAIHMMKSDYCSVAE